MPDSLGARLTAGLGNARAAACGVTGLLRVGFTVTIPSEPLTRLVQAFEAAHRDCRVTLVEHSLTGDDWDVWRPLRDGETDVLVYWNGMDEHDLTAGPALAWLDRVLLVGRGHRLAGQESVSAEELAYECTMQRPSTFPPAIMDMLIPSFTPSGRAVQHTEPARSLHEIMSLVAQGRIVHATVAGILPARRDDIVPLPISDLPPSRSDWSGAPRMRTPASAPSPRSRGNSAAPIRRSPEARVGRPGPAAGGRPAGRLTE